MEYVLSVTIIIVVAGFFAYRALKNEGVFVQKKPKPTPTKVEMCRCGHPDHMPEECPECFHGSL